MADSGRAPGNAADRLGALFSSLDIRNGERLLIRGGTTSVGMTAIALASRVGAQVTATTRRQERLSLLSDLGAHTAIMDDGVISAGSQRYDKVLELIGTRTLLDSLRCADRGGLVSMVGIVGNKWTIDEFAPMDSIPNRVALTAYSGEQRDFLQMPFQEMIDDVASGLLKVKLGPSFSIDEISDAHRCMEANAAEGKIVVVV